MRIISQDDKTGYRVAAKANKTGEISLYGPIGKDWFGDGIDAKRFAQDLKALGAVDEIDVRINSEGGVVTDARAMYTLLVQHKAQINVHIDGLAASAASFLALAGDSIAIAEGGFFMIHNPHMLVIGTSKEMREGAALLDLVGGTILDTYVARSGQPRAQVQKWMDEETWFTGKDTVKHGFADSIVADLRVAASVRKPEFFRNLPSAISRPNVAAARELVGTRHR